MATTEVHIEDEPTEEEGDEQPEEEQPEQEPAAADGESATAVPFDLPEYHGRKPSGMKTTVNGAGNRISRAHELGERVVLVLEAKVKKAGHEETEQNGLEYSETLKVVDLYEIAGEPGRALLTDVRRAYRLADDQRTGRQSLPIEEPPAGIRLLTDENGTLLTPAEAAELGQYPWGQVESPWLVIFECGHQRRWPDEFPPDTPAPATGDDAPCTQCRAETGAVRKVTMARPSWTPADEDETRCAHVLVGGRRCIRDVGHEPPHQDEHLSIEDDPPPPPEPVGEEPWPGYASEGASSILREIAKWVEPLDALAKVRDYEAANKARKSILGAIDKRIGSN